MADEVMPGDALQASPSFAAADGMPNFVSSAMICTYIL